MDGNTLMWMEVGFSVLYLILIWTLVVVMRVHFDRVDEKDHRVANLLWVAFFSLAFGDTFHVGARIISYFLKGGLDATIQVFGTSYGIVGWSALITAVTVTIFYLFFLVTWIVCNQGQASAFVYFLFTVAGIRLGLLVLPENQWNQPTPVQPWYMIRNLPFLILGIGVAALYLKMAVTKKDRTSMWIGILILFSFLTYLPIVVLIQANQLLGMLMIPKTIAYLGMGALIYNDLYRSPSSPKTRG
ncbi:MAG: hypothetical protein R6U57_09915 [Anaerolineales bacterium]